jgi:hypothetical protein
MHWNWIFVLEIFVLENGTTLSLLKSLNIECTFRLSLLGRKNWNIGLVLVEFLFCVVGSKSVKVVLVTQWDTIISLPSENLHFWLKNMYREHWWQYQKWIWSILSLWLCLYSKHLKTFLWLHCYFFSVTIICDHHKEFSVIEVDIKGKSFDIIWWCFLVEKLHFTKVVYL